ncbi:MAG: hydrolase, partial [Methylophilaceae bacterium]
MLLPMNNPSLNLLVQHQSQLLVIDVQEKLTAVMPSAPMQSMLKQSQVLLQAADLLAVPVLLTEQYPKG